MEDLSEVLQITLYDLHNGVLLEKMVLEDHTGILGWATSSLSLLSGTRQQYGKIQMQKDSIEEKKPL